MSALSMGSPGIPNDPQIRRMPRSRFERCHVAFDGLESSELYTPSMQKGLFSQWARNEANKTARA